MTLFGPEVETEVEETKLKKLSPFDFVKQINGSKQDLWEDDEQTAESSYIPFIINRAFSMYPDTCIQANYMNLWGNYLSKHQQNLFLLNSISRGKRFSPWPKKVSHDNIKIVKEVYHYSDQKAVEALGLLSDQDIQELKRQYRKGGLEDDSQ